MTRHYLYRFVLLLLAVTAGRLEAQIPSGYYNNATGKTGDELKIALHDIIDEHTTISYQQIWSAFWSTDNKGNNVVWDMYSDGANYTYNYYNGNDQCGDYEQEGDCYNREHSWPQSWFGNASTPTTDLHHIFPTDGFVNFKRSNHPFGEVQSATWTSQNGSKLGTCKSSLGYSGTVFEPIDEYKGDFARALMYMSVRYYGEDSDWSTSGMTNKSVIKPWAIDMLLDWSDNDPVSQKEIDRNNAVYGIQGNRNPFIDHPEYAHIIWEEGWTGVTYNITCANVQHGSISAPATAVEGTMVSLTATPAQGYMLGSWNVYKTGDTSTTVPVSNNGTFTMPSFNVTVSATFVQNTTLYNITCATGLSHGSISANLSSAQSGTTITLSNTPANGYNLYSYYVYKTGDINTIVYSGSSNTFTMPAFDVTVSASFAQPSSYSYVKVTAAPTDWSGEYLLVYENSETSAYVWTGVDENNCYSEQTITNNTIANGNMVSITIAPMTGGYSIKVKGGTNNGKYIYGTSGSNKINFGNSASLNTLSYESNSVIITSNTSVMRFNNAENQKRFRYFKSDTYTQQQPVQLYKKTGNIVTPTHTIQFNSNAGSNSTQTQTVNEFEPTALQANTFTRENYAFDSWNTAADGTGTTYFDGATVTLLNDLTLYAQWKQLFTITLATVENGTITASQDQAVEGDVITLTATPAATYEFDHWTVMDASENPITVTENQFEMPAANVTVSATFVYAGQPFVQEYHLVTSTDQLVAGRTYLIVNTSAGQALSTTQNNNNRAGVGVTITNGVIASIGSTVCELTLGGSTGAWTFFDANWGNNGGYLYAASSSNNYLKTQATNNANGEWSVSIASNGTATIVAQGDNTRNNLRYNPNNNSPIFSCYGSTSDLAKVELYIRSEEYDHTESETIAHLFPFDKHTVYSGATLTVTGTATCTEASHLVIEEGAQFVHHTNGVNALVKKSITGYSGESGWYTLATPFTNADLTCLTATDDFDLYTYDEDNDLEWQNYKADPDIFVINPGYGYLYAHNPALTLRMNGTLNNGDYSPTIQLSCANDDEDLRGYNLLGNPTAHAINFTKSDNVADGYYWVENGSTLTYETGSTVPAGRGFFVKANATNQSVILNSDSRRDSQQEEGQFLCIDIDGDKVYVKQNEGISMPLFSLNGKRSSLSLKHEGKPYVMLVRNEATEMPLNYEARTNGIHTLSVSLNNTSLDYLHLIDNLTGADIDLLQTPEYRFTARTKDYASRFRLLFADSASSGTEAAETFAYYNGSEWVTANNDNATLQVVDMMGRIIVSRDDVHSISTNGMAPGLYVLRLISGNDVKVQKILVK
jgi:endonuclease I